MHADYPPPLLHHERKPWIIATDSTPDFIQSYVCYLKDQTDNGELWGICDALEKCSNEKHKKILTLNNESTDNTKKH